MGRVQTTASLVYRTANTEDLQTTTAQQSTHSHTAAPHSASRDWWTGDVELLPSHPWFGLTAHQRREQWELLSRYTRSGTSLGVRPDSGSSAAAFDNEQLRREYLGSLHRDLRRMIEEGEQSGSGSVVPGSRRPTGSVGSAGARETGRESLGRRIVHTLLVSFIHTAHRDVLY